MLISPLLCLLATQNVLHADSNLWLWSPKMPSDLTLGLTFRSKGQYQKLKHLIICLFCYLDTSIRHNNIEIVDIFIHLTLTYYTEGQM